MIVLAAVVGLHALALLLLLAEMRTRLMRNAVEASPLSVWLLEPQAREAARAATRPSSRSTRPILAPVPRVESEPPPPTAPPAPAAIDWTAEAAVAASRQSEADTERNRQARALAPKTDPMFAARVKRPEFHWDYAHTHRIEPAGGLATIVHLNDRCAIAFFLIIPFAGGCALEKPEARGDLFEHMHDTEPPAQP